MNNRIQIIENNLNIKLPEEYKQFIINKGLISDSYEVYGYIENMDISKIPCVIGATKLYKENYKNIKDNEIVIAFDDYKNNPIIINEDNNIYNVDYNEKKLIAKSFNEWLENYKNENN